MGGGSPDWRKKFLAWSPRQKKNNIKRKQGLLKLQIFVWTRCFFCKVGFCWSMPQIQALSILINTAIVYVLTEPPTLWAFVCCVDQRQRERGKDSYLWCNPRQWERDCETADHVWLSHPLRSEKHLDLTRKRNKHTHSLRLQTRAEGWDKAGHRLWKTKRRHEKNVLVMSFSSCLKISIKRLLRKTVSWETDEQIKQKGLSGYVSVK